MEQPALTPTKSEYYVYFHIRDTGRRDASVATDPRVVLAAFNYRVIRGVERIGGGFPNNSEVRFFGEDQRADAEQLAKYLDYQFRGENLRFKAKPIGKDYPNMPPQNIEVWVIDPQP
jgi:hypothetical protein